MPGKRRCRSAGRHQKTVLAAAVGMALASQAPVATALTYTVTNTDSSGPGSLDQAITDANEASDADVIVFDVNGTIDMLSGRTISEPVTIDGPGSDTLTVRAGCESFCDPLFSITAGTGEVTIRGLTLDTSTDTFDDHLIRHTGGAALNIQDSALPNNGGFSTIYYGGAIYTSGGSLTIENTTISNQKKTGTSFGSALTVWGPVDLTIRNSTLTNNDRQAIEYRGSGGSGSGSSGNVIVESSTFNENIDGVAEIDAANVTIRDSRFVDNGDSDSAALWVSASSALIENSRFGGSSAMDPAGAVRLAAPDNLASSFTLQNATVTNSESESSGGGLYLDLGISSQAQLNINETYISGNSTLNLGGGVYVNAVANGASLALTIDSSVISDNEVESGPGGGVALNLGGTPSTIAITNSTFSGNSSPAPAGGAGGGIYIEGESVDLEVVNTTISGNSTGGSCAAGGGAGIAVIGGSEGTFDADFLNVTVAGNSAMAADGCGGGIGADRASVHMNVAMTIVNSIIAGNSAAAGPDLNGQAGVINVDYSLIGDNTDSNLAEMTASNIIGDTAASADPMLDALADNGGVRLGADADVPLSTHAIREGSPVIGAADQSATHSPLTLPETDQRGDGFDRIRDGGLDMGAVEFIEPESGSSSSSSSSSGSSSGSSSSSSSGSSSRNSSSSSSSGGGGSGSGGGSTGPWLLLALLSLMGLRRRK